MSLRYGHYHSQWGLTYNLNRNPNKQGYIVAASGVCPVFLNTVRVRDEVGDGLGMGHVNKVRVKDEANGIL